MVQLEAPEPFPGTEGLVLFGILKMDDPLVFNLVVAVAGAAFWEVFFLLKYPIYYYARTKAWGRSAGELERKTFKNFGVQHMSLENGILLWVITEKKTPAFP